MRLVGPVGAAGAVDVDAVTRLVEHVARTVVTPRFRTLAAGDVTAKGVDDLVTVVDMESEAALVEGLGALLPGVPVVAEEAAAADPRILGALTDAPRAWVVDPLDGTSAFVEGSPDHAVMVSLVEHGVPVAAWVCLPAHGQTYVAERGSGAWVDGRRVTREAAVPGALRGGVAVWAMDAWARERLEAEQDRLGPDAALPQKLWSGYEYSRLARGDKDFLAYWRTSPWDHAPGAVLTREVGGVCRFLDGREYTAVPMGGPLLAAADPVTWRTLHEILGYCLLER